MGIIPRRYNHIWEFLFMLVILMENHWRHTLGVLNILGISILGTKYFGNLLLHLCPLELVKQFTLRLCIYVFGISSCINFFLYLGSLYKGRTNLLLVQAGCLAHLGRWIWNSAWPIWPLGPDFSIFFYKKGKTTTWNLAPRWAKHPACKQGIRFNIKGSSNPIWL